MNKLFYAIFIDLQNSLSHFKNVKFFLNISIIDLDRIMSTNFRPANIFELATTKIRVLEMITTNIESQQTKNFIIPYQKIGQVALH